MATDPQSLLAQANCFQCHAPNSYTLQLMKLSLLAQNLLALDPTADVTPQGLLDQAKCFACFSGNPYALQLIELVLIKRIADATV